MDIVSKKECETKTEKEIAQEVEYSIQPQDIDNIEKTTTDASLLVEDLELSENVDIDDNPDEDECVTEQEVIPPNERANNRTKAGASLPTYHEKPTHFFSPNDILLQPEMRFLKHELENQEAEVRKPRSRLNSSNSVFSEEELSLVRRFPWLAERLKLAWEEVKELSEPPKKPKSKKKVQSAPGSTASILKQRKKSAKASLKMEDTVEKKEAVKPKVVFSRNLPLFVYSGETKKAIKVGGDTAKNMSEDVYKALEYNPELKKVTLDLQDLCKPEKERTIRLAVAYISSTTNFNPLVITEHMARCSAKKNAAIKYLVNEIEKRLYTQRELRIARDERWRKQLHQIVLAKIEAEQKENDIMVAKRQLEESRKSDQRVFTEYERQQERRRRIQLRTKTIPVADRVPVNVTPRQRRFGIHHISLQNNLLAPPNDGL